jgi:hypothetical protein
MSLNNNFWLSHSRSRMVHVLCADTLAYGVHPTNVEQDIRLQETETNPDSGCHGEERLETKARVNKNLGPDVRVTPPDTTAIAGKKHNRGNSGSRE